MLQLFENIPEALENTHLFAEKCNFMLKESKPQLPRYLDTENKENDLIVKLANDGLEERFVEHNIQNKNQYIDQLNYELSVIKDLGFSGYFLIVSDFIKFALKNDIPVGPGRGSGAGSIVAWSLKITNIDPLRFNLVFERFLNPHRVTMTDFDIDFCPEGRSKVIKYVQQKYGENHVAHIVAFGSLQARAALKDVGRVMKLPYYKVDALAKKVPSLFGKSFSLQETFDKDESFANMIKNDKDLNKLFQLSKKLEGLHRHISVHAAGVVIANQPIYKIMPLNTDENSFLLVTQFSMKHVEKSGLVKFDFLGLTALTIINETIKLLPNKIDINEIALNDEKTYEMLCNGLTVGVFQFETKGMTKLIFDMQANSIEDLIAVVALYRPGPMDNIPKFLRHRKGEEKENYSYEGMKNILGVTNGILIYQEQIIHLAKELAGYSSGEADLLRYAMGKKVVAEMERQRQIFVNGILKKQGGERSVAEELFEEISRFANYAFNKAHSTAYAIIGYQMAYLKSHYSAEFLSSAMTYDQHNIDKLSLLIQEARRMKITILPPNINYSFNKFTLEKGMIRYSLGALKNIGESHINSIIQEREKQYFLNFEDFMRRVNINKRSVESLINAGVFDDFNQNRAALHAQMNYVQKTPSLFSIEESAPKVEIWNESITLQKEYESFGLYFNRHPLHNIPYKILKLQNLIDNDISSCVGIVEGLQMKQGKSGPYAIVALSDNTGNISCLAMSSELILIEKAAQNREPIWMKIEKGRSTIIRECMYFSDYINSITRLHIYVTTKLELKNLHQMLSTKLNNQNNTEIYLHFENDTPLLIGKLKLNIEMLKELEKYKISI